MLGFLGSKFCEAILLSFFGSKFGYAILFGFLSSNFCEAILFRFLRIMMIEFSSFVLACANSLLSGLFRSKLLALGLNVAWASGSLGD